MKAITFYKPSADLAIDLTASAAQFSASGSTLTYSDTSITLRGPTYRLEVSGQHLVVALASRTLENGSVTRIDLFEGDALIATASVVPLSHKGLQTWSVTAPLSLSTVFSTIEAPTALILNGSQFDDILLGGIYGDGLFGNSGNDIAIGAQGDDGIRGGRGLDTANYSGPIASYRVSVQPNFEMLVEDTRAGSPDGTDSLSDVDRLQFVDATVSAYDLMFAGGSPAAATGPRVYRFNNVDTGTYFYTSDPFERDYLLNFPNQTPMRLDGVAFNARETRAQGDVPVFRFANESNGAYFLTASPEERDWVLMHRPDLRMDYAFFFAPTDHGAGTMPVYRLANLVTGSYLYTVIPEDRAHVLSLGTWRDEGIGFYAPTSTTTKASLLDEQARVANGPLRSRGSDAIEAAAEFFEPVIGQASFDQEASTVDLFA